MLWCYTARGTTRRSGMPVALNLSEWNGSRAGSLLLEMLTSFCWTLGLDRVFIVDTFFLVLTNVGCYSELEEEK